MATREDDTPFGPTPDEEEAGRGPSEEETGPTLEDAFEGAGEEEERFVAGEGPPPEGPEAGTAEEGAEGTPGEEAPEETGEEADEGIVRYRDPETGTFISAEEARERDLEPEELQTEEEAAEELFGEDEEVEGEEEETEEEGQSVVLEGDGEEAEGIELVVDDPEAAERIEAMREAAQERDELRDQVDQLEEVREQVEADAAELQAIEEELATDPVPFLMDTVPEDDRTEVVRAILATDDEVYERVLEDVEEWVSDPRERRLAKAEMDRDLTEKRYERKERRETSRKVQRNAREILTALDAVSEEADTGNPELLFSDLRDDIARFAEENDRATMSMEEIAEIPRVRQRLQAHGLSPEVLLQVHGQDNGGRPRRGRGSNGREVVRADPSGERERELAEEAEKYREHGERLRKAHARKKDAAASTSPGAGATPASGPEEALKGATLDEAFDIADRRVGEGR